MKIFNVTLLMFMCLYSTAQQTIKVSSIEQLDDLAEFSFSIMSDNNGYSSTNWINYRDANARGVDRFERWVKANDEFCIGNGDLAIGSRTSWIEKTQNDNWFKNNFYPNVGDNCNETNYFYGNVGSQAHWGRGWVMFKALNNFFNRSNVEFRQPESSPVFSSKSKNESNTLVPYEDQLVDYYATQNIGKFKIHMIFVHFATPGILQRRSIDFMMDKVSQIKANKTDYDILFVMAHRANWLKTAVSNTHNMTSSERNLLMSTADFITNGDSHKFHRKNDFDGQYNSLWVNSGALANTGSTWGYLNIHVFDNPPRFTVQYIDVQHKNQRKLHIGQIEKMSPTVDKQYTVPMIKWVNGRYDNVDWNNFEINNQNTPSGLTIHNGENQSNWSSHNALQLSSDRKEGSNSLQSNGRGTADFIYKPSSTIDLRGAKALKFWYYVSDKNRFNASNQVELGSGGRADLNEYNWSIDVNSLQNGWNEITLNMSDASTSSGTPDMSRINWFRLYRSKRGNVISRIDQIRMVEEDGSPNNPSGLTIHNGENPSNWSSYNTLQLSSDRQQGSSSLQSNGRGTADFIYKPSSALNLSGGTTLKFWYYVSDKNRFNASNQVELGSGGRADLNEYSWKINTNSIQNGWNEISLNIRDAVIRGEAPDMSKINWFRLYRSKRGNVTSRIDQIRMINESRSSYNILEDTTINDKNPLQAEHKLFPNPTKGEINILLAINQPNKTSIISIKNLSGKTVYQKVIPELEMGNHKIKIPKLKLNSAVYMAEITTGEQTKTIKFLFEN